MPRIFAQEELLRGLGRTEEQIREEIGQQTRIYGRSIHHRIEYFREKHRRYNNVLRRVMQAISLLSESRNHNDQRVLRRIHRSVGILSSEVTFEGNSFIRGETGINFQQILEEEIVAVFEGPLEGEVIEKLREVESNIHVWDHPRMLDELRGLRKTIQRMVKCLEVRILRRERNRDRRPEYEPYVAAKVIYNLIKQRNQEAERRGERIPFRQVGFCGAWLMHYLGYDPLFPQAAGRTHDSAVNRFWTRCNWKNLRRVGLSFLESMEVQVIEFGRDISRRQ